MGAIFNFLCSGRSERKLLYRRAQRMSIPFFEIFYFFLHAVSCGGFLAKKRATFGKAAFEWKEIGISEIFSCHLREKHRNSAKGAGMGTKRRKH